jgi:hypothetical protein
MINLGAGFAPGEPNVGQRESTDMKPVTRCTLAIGLVVILTPLGYGDPPSKAEVVDKTAEAPQSTWMSTVKGYSGSVDRRGMFNEMLPELRKGLSQAEVEMFLGTANAVSQCAGGSLWTYVLNHGCEAQLLFNTTSNLDRAVVLEYPDDQENRGEWKTEGRALPQEIEKESLSGMWRAITSL